jgi:hypothetical protein
MTRPSAVGETCARTGRIEETEVIKKQAKKVLSNLFVAQWVVMPMSGIQVVTILNGHYFKNLANMKRGLYHIRMIR